MLESTFSLATESPLREWRADLELRLRSRSTHPALESHHSKYRKLVPAVALITHLADMGVVPENRMRTGVLSVLSVPVTGVSLRLPA
jgi:hypothetical protein